MKVFCMTMIAVCASALLSLSATAATESFDLRVNDVSGLDSPWPLIGGLPFAEGALHDPSQIRVVDAQGNEVPAQIDVAATWRDGSIRWALAGLTASPQGDYRVEYGTGVSRSTPAQPLVVKQSDDGAVTVDTGAAVYEFRPDLLLPDSARMGETTFLFGSGNGAYLVDNHGRLARVAGALADIKTEIAKQGPARTVIRREGWYVTDEGERIARARVWFYLAAGSPYLRITHSLIFTEDTNDLWVRDYGLKFRTPEAPETVTFELCEPASIEELDARHGEAYGKTVTRDEVRDFASLYSSPYPGRQRQRKRTLPFEGDELYMLQDDYPHFLEREFRAVIARVPLDDAAPATRAEVRGDNLWVHPWIERAKMAGDWGDGDYGGYGLTVVAPRLAQRFPKEIAFGSDGVRVALWSGRSGRELDFRAVTLVNEYWGLWPERRGRPTGPQHATELAKAPSNAQGAARTHDVWLLPRVGGHEGQTVAKRATAASNPPLLQADPVWLCATEAFGFPMHPKDLKRFPEVEEAMSDYWEQVVHEHNQALRRTGFIDWGGTITLSTPYRFFRLTPAADYGFRFNTLLLYVRSGERRYYDFAAENMRFVGDWRIVQWPAGNKRMGERPSGDETTPMYWGDGSDSKLYSGTTLDCLHLHYYLTGDEYGGELMRLVGDAYRKRWEEGTYTVNGELYAFAWLRTLSELYMHTWDDTFKTMAKKTAHLLIDPDNPVGLNDDYKYGLYYKTSKELVWPLYRYYEATGDETARTAILRAMDDKFRFFYTNFQTFRLFLFAEAYNWTGNQTYLNLIKLMVEQPFFGMFGEHFFLGAPTALHAIANADKPIGPFPILAATRMKPTDNKKKESVMRSFYTGLENMDHQYIEGDALPPILVDKKADTAVNLSVYVRVGDELDENAEPAAKILKLVPDGGGGEVDGVRIEKRQRFQSKRIDRNDPRRWHFYLTLPAEAEAGRYQISFPGAATLVVLESNAEKIGLP